MVPNPREALEISRALSAAVGIAPEAGGHGRERRGAYEFAARAADRAALLVKDLDAHPQPTTLQLAAIHGPNRTAERETGNDVGASGNGGELHVGLDVAIDEVEAFGQKR